MTRSRYDHDQRGCEMTPQCAASAGCINRYGANLSSTLLTQLLGMSSGGPPPPPPSSPRSSGTGHTQGLNGAFLDSCTRHCTGSGPHWRRGTIVSGAFP
jgi:hypothetical protein